MRRGLDGAFFPSRCMPSCWRAQLGHSDIRTTLDIYTQITDPEVARMVNQVTNRILGLGEEGEPGSVQCDGRAKF